MKPSFNVAKVQEKKSKGIPEIKALNIESISVKYHPRQDIGNIETLTHSINKLGLQEPLAQRVGRNTTTRAQHSGARLSAAANG